MKTFVSVIVALVAATIVGESAAEPISLGLVLLGKALIKGKIIGAALANSGGGGRGYRRSGGYSRGHHHNNNSFRRGGRYSSRR